MNMDANAVQQWGKKCNWFSGNTVDGAAGSGRSGTKSGPSSASNKFDQILKQVNNQDRESKVVVIPPPLLYIYIFPFKTFSTFIYTYTASCCNHNPNSHLIDCHSAVKKWWRLQDSTVQTVWDGGIGQWENFGEGKTILTMYMEEQTPRDGYGNIRLQQT